jgi:hypothetical protein
MDAGDPIRFLSFAFFSTTTNGRFVSSQTVWYLVSNQSISWANCAYVISNAFGATP